MAYYIISLDSIIKTFSVVGTDVEFDYIQEAEKTTKPNIQVGDTVLAYVGDPVEEVRYGFKLKAKKDEGELTLRKEFEFAQGLKRADMPKGANDVLRGLLNGQMALLEDADYFAIIAALFNGKGGRAAPVPKASSLPAELTTKFNWIVFGAPGTGKSTRLNNFSKNFGPNYERVTFHPSYSYANFVGTYKPRPTEDGEGKPAITYAYVPGPFLRTLVAAIKNVDQPFLLLIEEINRANVTAVFGDVFQLLDRRNGESEFPISISMDMLDYLGAEFEKELGADYKLSIPSNLYIWATMNSADQGVFPVDSAFKRRWEFTYLGVNENADVIANKEIKLSCGQTIEWDSLRRHINERLTSSKVNEDKLLGPFFLALDKLNDPLKFEDAFKSKVLMYLFEDAARHCRDKMFAAKPNATYSMICDEFDKNGEQLFKFNENQAN